MEEACENCNLNCKTKKLDSSTTAMHYAQLQKALEDCTKTRKERGGLMKLLPTKQKLGNTKINTPAKSSYIFLFEQFIAIKASINSFNHSYQNYNYFLPKDFIILNQ